MTAAANSSLLGFLSSGEAVGYQIERSLRFNSSDSAYLSRTPASAGNRKTWTWAGWVKRSAGSYVPLLFARDPSLSGWQYFFLATIDADKILIETGSHVVIYTEALYRDFSAWMHVVFAVDATQATATNRLKLYVNGLEVTSFSTDGRSNITQNVDGYINSTNAHQIGSSYSDTRFADGYLADIHFIDGQALTPSSFAETNATTGQWVPKAYTGSYGTNGFRLDFSDNSAATATTLGKDRAGSNNWTPNNFSVAAGSGNDSLVDSPTSYGTDTAVGGEVRGNYATWNPLTGAITLTNGNLDGNSTGGAWRGATGTTGVLSGKWYWESTIQNTDSGNYYGEFGFIKTTDITGAITFPSGMNGIVYYARNGRKISGGTSVATSSSGATTGDIVQVAVDLDAGKIWFGVNNTWIDSGNPASGANAAYTGLSGTYLPALGVLDGGKCNTNFGQRAFAYAAPSGFKALCDTNLPAPVVAKPNTAFDVALWTGNGSARSITGLNFNPDFVWIKGRSGATDHALYDVVRGTEKRLESNNTDTEVTSDGGVTAFNSDGFSLGTLAQVNTNSSTYVGWAWDAGSSTVTNTQGSITSQVRANASAGFSIVTYTGNGTAGATIGHGLGVAPQFVIVKNRSNATNWMVGHHFLDATTPWNYYMRLNGTIARAAAADFWNNTAPSGTVITLGTSTSVNSVDGDSYVAYCFAPVAGYSNGFSYTGNGSTDGSFVYLGFRPRLILLKCSSTTGNWTLLDTAREGYNVDNDPLYPNLSDAEGTTDLLDITSNGFKLRTTDASVNSSGATYVGYAWAEAPFAYSRAR